jgi:methanogenic corrinoid protein MtbC1
MRVEDGPPGGSAIISAVSQNRKNRAVDRVEQRASQGSVALVHGGQLGSQIVAAVGLDSQVQPASAAARLATMLLMQLLTRVEKHEDVLQR